MDDRHFGYITKLTPPPKKKPLKSQISKWSGEKDEKKTSLQTDNSVDSTTTLMFGVPSPANRVFGLSGSLPSRWNKSYITFLSPVCPQPAVCPEGCGKTA